MCQSHRPENSGTKQPPLLIKNKIRNLFKVKLYTIRSENKKRERKKERERLKIFINPNTDRGS